MKKTFLSLFAATALLANCETKKSETKDQLGEAGQDGVVIHGTNGDDHITIDRQVGPSGAQIVVTTNPGCILQIQAGLRKAGVADVEVMHIADFLLLFGNETRSFES